MPDYFDATKSGPKANAYADTDFADSLLDSIFGAEEWAVQTDDVKERLLITATRAIERLSVTEDKAAATQALKFPVDDADDDGWPE